MATKTASKKTASKNTGVRTYKLGDNAQHLYNRLQKAAGKGGSLNKSLIEQVASKGEDSPGYVKYMIGSMRKKGFIKLVGGKMVLGDGTKKVARKTAKA